MSQLLRKTAATIADELTRRAADLLRERAADLTPEESDARVSAELARMAERLRAALAKGEVERDE